MHVQNKVEFAIPCPCSANEWMTVYAFCCALIRIETDTHQLKKSKAKIVR